MKPAIQSKTIWLHVISAAILAWQEVSPVLPEAIVVKGALVVNVLAIILRFVTNEAIGGGKD